MTSAARAVKYACRAAFPAPAELDRDQAEAWRRRHHWHPHQLRHNAATRFRREFGLDVAQVLLGHKTLAVTQVYAERDVHLAGAVDEQTFASKNLELRDRVAKLTLQMEATDRKKDENADLALRV